MSMIRRRTLLQGAGAITIAPALMRATNALAQSAQPTYLIEFCLRDQVDFGHIMVAPGLARDANLKRGENGRKAAMFFTQSELTSLPNNVFLTPQSLALKPHLDTVAMMELAELTWGPVHGHEAANPLRTPGRGNKDDSAIRLPVWEGEPGKESGEGAYYSSTPTPLALHNRLQKQITAGLGNAVVIKGTQRAGAIYHFGAGLSGAEPDRFQDVNSLLKAFPAKSSSASLLPTAEARGFEQGLSRFDKALLARRGMPDAVFTNHSSQLAEASAVLGKSATSAFSLALTDQERAAWSAGIPSRYGRTLIDVWEQSAYAVKLLTSGLVRSVAIEVDIGDVHGERTASQMQQQTGTIVLPLVRMIEKLKAAGIYDRSLIIVSTTDGGRSPAANSSGDEGKNGVILAGGMIRGGYYGDMKADSPDGDGHHYRYMAPDVATGVPDSVGSLGNDRRLPAASLWRTMMTALGTPEATLNQFPSVASARALPWLLRS